MIRQDTHPPGRAMNAESTIAITVFQSVKDNVGAVARTVWPTFVNRTTTHVEGSKATKLICGALFVGTRAQKNVKTRTCYLLDVEPNKSTGEVPPDREYVIAAMQRRGWAGTIYSTHSHTTEAPRYRVALLPETAIDINGDQAALADDGVRALGLASMIGLGGVVDTTKLTAESLYYLPTHPPGGEYFGAEVEGRAITAAELDEALTAGKRLRADDDEYRAAAQDQRPAAQNDSVIAAYNASVATAQLLERHGYRRRPRSTVDWRSPYQTSEDSYATRVMDGDRWVTLSASDMAAGIGRHSRSGISSSGDAFDLFCHYEHRGDQKAAMRAAAKLLGLDAKKPAADTWSDPGVSPDSDKGPGGDKPVHPLARFVPTLPETLTQPRMILPGLIAAGTVVIAGQHGVGKTTVLASIVVKVAGATVPGDPLAPRYGRHVVYISEDTDQFQRIMYAVSKAIPGAADIIRKRVHLVEAVRLPVDQVVEVAKFYAEQFTEVVDGVRLPPLVVLDTRSAIIAVDDENDNAETSEIMAALKQRFAGLPVWIVGHVAKASFGRADAKNMSARGATALEGDAHQVIFIVIEDDDQRFLIRGKTRFEAAIASCRLVSHVDHEWGVDEFGEACEIPVRHVTIEPLTSEEEGDRKAQAGAIRAAEKEERTREKHERIRQEILEFVRQKASEGVLMGKTDVAERLGGSRSQRLKVINELIEDGLLVPNCEWPDKARRHSQSDGFLEALNEAERFVHERTGYRPNVR